MSQLVVDGEQMCSCWLSYARSNDALQTVTNARKQLVDGLMRELALNVLLLCPAGSGFSSAVSHPATNGSAYGSFTHQDAGAAALRSSAGSLSDLLPGSAAPTPGPAAPAHRLGEAAVNDPFAGLAPGLRSALPAVPQSSSKFGGAPPPTPAGGPPFGFAAVNGGAVPPIGMPAAGPFAGAPAASPAGMAPATAAASATLFGRNPSLTGYDLSAPAAPKPAASGNPFA